MADYKVTDAELTALANAIRTKGGTQASLEWNAGYIAAVNSISNTATLVSKSITQNGTYNPANDNADGYSEVTVSVSGGSAVVQPLERRRNATIGIDSAGRLDPSGYSGSVIMEWQIEVGKRYIFYLSETVGDRLSVSMYDQEVFTYAATAYDRLPGDVVVPRMSSGITAYYSTVFVATKPYLCAHIDTQGRDIYSFVMEMQYE